MADRLRQAAVGHCDLQHGNVLMVPQDSGSLALRLIDYDGVHVPSLAGTQSPELGHPAFQHPQRSSERVYSAEVDRFSHLAIYTSIHCLTVGREELWKRFNNDENLLFREEDYRRPAESEVFRTLWKLPDAGSRALVGRLALACEKPLDQVPLLDEVADGEVYPLTQAEEQAVDSLLGSGPASHPVAVAGSTETAADLAMPESDSADKPLLKVAPKATPKRYDPWLLPLALLRVLDWPLKKMVGEEKEILHNFLRIMASLVLAILIVVSARMASQRIENARHPVATRPEATNTPVSPNGLPADIGLPEQTELLDEMVGSLDEITEIPSAQQATTPEPEPEPSPKPEPALAPATPEPAADLPEDYTNDIGMQFKLIPAGEFMMGSPDNDRDKQGNEAPQHRVRITRPFYLGIHEVTQEQYETVMGKNPSHFKGPSRPMENVYWEDATEFCRKLSEMDEEYDYRLPTEAEWEYACRAGTTTRYCCGDVLDPGYAWASNNSRHQTHPVGEKEPNDWGLFDMHGNVYEWCQDWYDSGYYGSSPSEDPPGPATGSGRVIRSGGWNAYQIFCRSARRTGNSPTSPAHTLGFRVALVPAESAALPEDTMPTPEPEPEPALAPATPEPAADLPEDYSNDIGMQFKLIPAGEFMMGTTSDDGAAAKVISQKPQHGVRITKPFYLGIYEVTQEQYEKVTGSNPSWFKGKSLPVERVSWGAATAFCTKLSRMDTDSDYRLPTEAEWEYACRAGTTTRFSCGRNLDMNCGWFDANSHMLTHPVGEKQPNAWGLYDMHGNVPEWCSDRYSST